jgi:hypothetical protein
MISGEVQGMLRKKGVHEETIKAYFDCLHFCDMKRFAPMDTDETEMRKCLKIAASTMTRLEKEILK